MNSDKYQRKYYRENRQYVIDRQKAYYQEHKQARLAYASKYRLDHVNDLNINGVKVTILANNTIIIKRHRKINGMVLRPGIYKLQ